MSAFRPKTVAEQRLEHLSAIGRPLTDQESDELRRSLHAVYCRNIRLSKAAKLEREMHSGALEEYEQHEAMIRGQMEVECRP